MGDRCCEHCADVDDMNDKLTSVLIAQGGFAESARNLTLSVQRIEEGMVTRHEFKPVRALVYGLVGLVMTGFVYTLVTKAGAVLAFAK